MTARLLLVILCIMYPPVGFSIAGVLGFLWLVGRTVKV